MDISEAWEAARLLGMMAGELPATSASPSGHRKVADGYRLSVSICFISQVTSARSFTQPSMKQPTYILRHRAISKWHAAWMIFFFKIYVTSFKDRVIG